MSDDLNLNLDVELAALLSDPLVLPTEVSDAYAALLRPPGSEESEQLAGALADMLSAIPAAMGLHDRGMSRLIGSIAPMMTLTLRTADPDDIREGMAAVLGLMLRQCATAGVPLDQIVRWMREPPTLEQE